MNRILYFTQPGCRLCAEVEPKVNELNRALSGSIEVLNPNTTGVASQYNVYGTPVLLILDGNREISRASGVNPITSLSNSLISQATQQGDTVVVTMPPTTADENTTPLPDPVIQIPPESVPMVKSTFPIVPTVIGLGVLGLVVKFLRSQS